MICSVIHYRNSNSINTVIVIILIIETNSCFSVGPSGKFAAHRLLEADC